MNVGVAQRGVDVSLAVGEDIGRGSVCRYMWVYRGGMDWGSGETLRCRGTVQLTWRRDKTGGGTTTATNGSNRRPVCACLVLSTR